MFFSLVRPDIAIVAEGVMILLEVLSFIFALIVVYICWIARPLRSEATSPSIWPLIAQALGFVVLTSITFAVSHFLAHVLDVASAAIALGVGIVVTSTYYFVMLRGHIRADDMRIQYTMMVWGGLGVISLVTLLFLYLARDHITFEKKSTISLDVLAQIAGIVVSAAGIVFTYIMKSEQSNKTANHKIYQTLELPAVDLFRFEIDHPDLIEALWFSEPPPKPTSKAEKVQEYCVKQYICQMLNLFEMAYRFRVQGIMGDDVFGSWVIWMWGLCCSPVFRHYWNDGIGLPQNYVADFSALMQAGVDLYDENKDEDELCREFFKIVSGRLNCRVVEDWLATTPRKRYGLAALA